MNKEKYQNLEQYDLDEYLIQACESKNMELVKYLLTSPELSKHADIHTWCRGENGSPLRMAFSKKYFDLAKYLLTSPDLKEHANIHVANDAIFRNAFFKKEIDVLECLIFDHQIDRNQNIDGIINNYKERSMGLSEHIEKIFSIRELNKDLHSELNIESTKENKSKNKL